MWRVAIVEDEPTDTAALTAYLTQWESTQPDCALSISTFSDAATFLAEKIPFDLLFFDIEMPGMNGMRAAQILRERSVDCPITFVTSLAQYAVASWEVGAAGYLVKPVDWGAFCLQMKRLKKRLARKDSQSIVLSSRGHLQVIPLSTLTYIEVKNHTVIYHRTPPYENISRHSQLAVVEEEIAHLPFVRCNPSCLVSMASIEGITEKGLCLASGDTIPVTASRREEVMNQVCTWLAMEASHG